MRLSAKRCDVIATQMARKLVSERLVSGVQADALAACLLPALVDDLSLEDRLGDEVREILEKNADQMRELGVEYHEAFKKIKAKLARDRKLVL